MLRLAAEHGVTEYQFSIVLAHWWNQTKSDYRFHLGRHVTYIAKIGHGRDIDTLIQALERGTGYSGFAGMTLSAFRDVSGVHVGTFVRGIHYWCPACMKEQVQRGLPVYEKLIWRLKAITRCSIHRIALECCCPSCGSHQSRHVDVWPECSACHASLVGDELDWTQVLTPSESEPDILEIVSYCAINPETVFRKDAARAFWELIRADKSATIRLKYDFFRRRHEPSRTLIDVLLRFAHEVQVPLLSILLDPYQAAAIRPLLGNLPSSEMNFQPKRRLTLKVREGLRQSLLLGIQSGEKYISLTELCRIHGCTSVVPKYWFPDLTEAFLARNRERRAVVVGAQARALERIHIDEGLDVRVTEVGWHEAIREVSREFNLPIHLVRDRLSVLRQMPIEKQSGCSKNYSENH